jgi:PIN domain
VIYLDSSVALAHLFAEGKSPPDSLWGEQLISSRLLEYENWSRIHAHKLGHLHGGGARDLIAGMALVELSPLILERALEPFPVRVRTLDGLHLATMDFLRVRRQPVELATYDDRLAAAARAMGVVIVTL